MASESSNLGISGIDEKKAYIFPLPTRGEAHSIVKLPSEPQRLVFAKPKPVNYYDTYTMAMIDVSRSMRDVFPVLTKSWNKYLDRIIRGYSELYVFGNCVEFIRRGTEMFQFDFQNGFTELTGALRKINETIHQRKEPKIRVILVTDGEHTTNNIYPDTVIKDLKPPEGKTVEVYILGIGDEFPVQYSIDIRSLLHNGSTYTPYLFWAKNEHDLESQIIKIREELLRVRETIKSSYPGQLCPYADSISEFNLSEWVYFKIPALAFKEVDFQIEDCYPIENIIVSNVSFDEIAQNIFSQWNKIILQSHRSKGVVDMRIFDVMEEIVEAYRNEGNTEGMTKFQKRLHEKSKKTVKTDFSTIINQSKKLIDRDAKFGNQIEMADLVLRTTSNTGKYNVKAMQLKGHTMNDFTEDLTVFRDKYDSIKSKIDELPNPSNDDCCRITVTCTIMDLKDPGFSDIYSKDKFDFLKFFTMSGIPVLIQIKDSLEMNSWTIHIKNILLNPFAILSQQALEHGGIELRDTDKSALLKKDDETTRFNGIVPVFPKGTVESLKPLLTTKIYSMCCTFSILKSVHILDYNCHLAALGCVWLKTIHDFPKSNRPEFIQDRLDMIEETCKIYIDRKGLKIFVETLLDNPSAALMTSNATTQIKCESMLKPLFLLHLYKSSYAERIESKKFEILKLILVEFVGRCLSGLTQNNADLYSSTFLQNYTDERTKVMESIRDIIYKPYEEQADELFKKYYTPEEMTNAIAENLRLSINDQIKKGLQLFEIRVNENKLLKLRNSGSCGDVTWEKIKSWSIEMNFAESEINELFGKEMAKLYFYHAMKYPASRTRMESEIMNIEVVDGLISKKIAEENAYQIRCQLMDTIPSNIKLLWREKYRIAHCYTIVSPMSKQAIIKKASELGIDVSAENFYNVYKYRENVGLLRNACMTENCPHFLQPRRTFNQHVSIERTFGEFPHNLHNVTASNTDKDADEVIDLVIHETRKRRFLGECGSMEFPLEEEGIEKLIEMYKKVY